MLCKSAGQVDVTREAEAVLNLTEGQHFQMRLCFTKMVTMKFSQK